MKYRMTDIENFVTTSNARTMMEAARGLEISQPALSESIKRLESDLGTILFYRSRSGIELTPDGRNFLTKARHLLQAVQDLEPSDDRNVVFGSRSITIGAHATVASYCLPRALGLLKKQAPDYKLSLKHDLSRNIQREVQHGRIDVGIVINPVRVPDLVISTIGDDTIAIWSAKDVKETDTLICNPDLFQSQSILKRW